LPTAGGDTWGERGCLDGPKSVFELADPLPPTVELPLLLLPVVVLAWDVLEIVGIERNACCKALLTSACMSSVAVRLAGPLTITLALPKPPGMGIVVERVVVALPLLIGPLAAVEVATLVVVVVVVVLLCVPDEAVEREAVEVLVGVVVLLLAVDEVDVRPIPALPIVMAMGTV